jgi:hypothetical protein
MKRSSTCGAGQTPLGRASSSLPSSMERTTWRTGHDRELVGSSLDSTIYVDAAQAFGLVHDSPKGAIRKRLGLPDGYFKPDAFGVEDYILFRWYGSENPLPVCPAE